MNIREIVGIAPNYSLINREERNFAAILFAALCKPGNSERFLSYCEYHPDFGDDFGIYVEYSYLRDLWNSLKDENVKKEIIRQHLRINNIDDILDQPIVEINRKFGVGGSPSRDFIQYPGKWAIINYNNNFPDNADFLKICRFKWSFNIKPDIVIHLNKDKAICIEAKYESREGKYPASGLEKEIFKKRDVDYIGQMDLQKYMMEELLGIKTDFMFLVFKKEKSDTHKVVSWSEAFGCLDLSDLPPFAIEMAGRISNSQSL